MESEKYYIKISPGVLENDIVSETYDGNTFGVYTGMTQILSGGTNGDSILTGLTIPVLFKDSFNDLGYYTPFDGFILQKEVVNNYYEQKGKEIKNSNAKQVDSLLRSRYNF